ncbi:hypothetical protein [Nonomuraea lactucae]|uniref:hypothetical protein n=1 Tax=Nonomuraea lactucae TaxID=2249762 RepID=UPI001964BED8
MPDTLVPEAGGVGRQPPDIEIQRAQLPAAVRADCADQFEILEQHITVISAHPLEERAANAERAGVVGAESAVEQGAGGVPAGVPGQSCEVVLGPHQLGFGQEDLHPGKGTLVIADVVIGDDHALGTRQPHAGQYATDLAVGATEIGGRTDMRHQAMPGDGVALEQPRGRTVDDDDPYVAAQNAQVGGQLFQAGVVLPAQGEHVIHHGASLAFARRRPT